MKTKRSGISSTAVATLMFVVSPVYNREHLYLLLTVNICIGCPWIENPSDKWIRCAVDTGDLMVLPAGIYHRFTLDERNVIKAMRLFKARVCYNISLSPIHHALTCPG